MQLLMPALSPTMTEGTIGKWLKREGMFGPNVTISQLLLIKNI